MITVSVIVPVYNGSKYIHNVYASLAHQTFEDFEVIFIDDGSKDNSLELIKKFANQNQSLKVRIKSITHSGLAAARNEGIRIAGGEFVAFLDCDDFWFADKLRNQVAAFKDNDIGAVFSQVVYLKNSNTLANHQSNISTYSDSPKSILDGKFIIFGGGSNVMCKTKIIRELGGFDETLRYGEDLDMWLRIAQISTVYQLPQVGARIWIRTDSMQRIKNPRVQIRLLSDKLKIYRKWIDSIDESTLRFLTQDFVDATLNNIKTSSFHELLLGTFLWTRFLSAWIFQIPLHSLSRARIVIFCVYRATKRRASKIHH